MQIGVWIFFFIKRNSNDDNCSFFGSFDVSVNVVFYNVKGFMYFCRCESILNYELLIYRQDNYRIYELNQNFFESKISIN